ncbi:MAG: Gfo/Idh/MocA family oxidoreductase [Oscillospiraceae bacterium]|nr:Gfo/Idh/MocA family oxidoreductase [Oscillospiraceae bacterium]
MIKLGIIGFGGIGHYHATNLIKRVDGIEVGGVFDIDPDRIEEAEKLGLRTYRTREEILGDPQIDIVLVSTPNDVHAPIALDAISAGKNVMLEKPAAMSAAEFVCIKQAADSAGVFLTVHQNRRFDKDFLIAGNVVSSGALGEIFSIESKVWGCNGIPPGWRTQKRNGGGMLFDWGVHLIDQMLLLVPEKIAHIYCDMHRFDGSDADDCFKLIIKFDSGKTALIDIGTKNFQPAPRWLISGTSGAMVINDWSCSGSVITAKSTDVYFEQEIVYTAAGPTKTMAPRNKLTLSENPLPDVIANGTEFYTNLVAALCHNQRPVVCHDEVIRVLRVIDAAFLSSESGKTIALDL